jgi:uncharacterized protein YjbI with pentapeptide repeats
MIFMTMVIQEARLNQAAFVEVDNADDINTDPDDIDYNFQNTPIAVKMSAIITGPFDWRNVNLLFNNCVFTNPQALKAERGYYTLFSNCTLTNSNIDVANTYWLNVRNTKIHSTNTTSATSYRILKVHRL